MKGITKDNLIKNGWEYIGTIDVGLGDTYLYQKKM